jgi:hypothetical protein
MCWGVESYYRSFFQCKLYLVSLVVPQVVYPETLLVMEVLLLSVISREISWCIQCNW